jgi:hypothetical protein
MGGGGGGGLGGPVGGTYYYHHHLLLFFAKPTFNVKTQYNKHMGARDQQIT